MSTSAIKYPHGHPFWLHKPDAAELAKEPEELLGLFESGHVFVNGIRGTPAHPDSYMTVLDYQRAGETFRIINEEFHLGADVWLNFADYFINHLNRQPATVLLGWHIKDLLNFNS